MRLLALIGLFALALQARAGISFIAVDTNKIRADAVTTTKVLNLAIDTTKLATDSVIGAKILDRTIDTRKLNQDIQNQLSAAGGITQLTSDVTAGPGSGSVAATIAASAVNTSKLASDAVITAKILDLNVTTAKIAATAVDTGKLASDSVIAAKILDAAINTNKLASDSVTTAKIINAAINTNKLLTGAVDSNKILNDSVTTVTIINSAVNTNKLASDAVTTAKLITAAVDTTRLAADSVSNAKILNASVDTNKMLTGAIDSNKIKNDSVTTVTIINSAVNTNKIATDSITNAKILNATIDTSKLSGSDGASGKFLGYSGGAVVWATPSGSSEVNASTSTILPVINPVNISSPVCVGTVTYTNPGASKFIFAFNGGAFNGTAASELNWTVLVDGADLMTTEGLPNSATSIARTRMTNSGSFESQVWHYTTTKTIAAAAHSFCVGVKASASSTHLDGEGKSPQLFQVIDLGR